MTKNAQPITISTHDLYVNAKKIYPRQVSGIFARLRILGVWILLGIYYVTPWITWNDRQAILFDLPARKFYWWGVTFWPQDFIYLTLLLIICALALFFFTSIAGRVWCGFACPQSVWKETFLWMERIVEGNRNQRMKLDSQPLTLNKATKKITKHLLWLSFSLFTGYTFVGYFTPIHLLTSEILTWTVSYWEMFWISFYSFATYGNAGWLREQLCIYMCPYARFQGAMFDKDTLIISYDNKRGEQRGHRKRTNTEYRLEGFGDCIDCHQCVQVCPTGIDIRDGLQQECIACAACIDICNHVMEQMNYPTNLIKYTTQHAEEGVKTRFVRAKIILQGLTLSLFIVGFIIALYLRVPIEFDIKRDRGHLFTERENAQIENVYTLKVANKDQRDHRFEISVHGLKRAKILGSSYLSVDEGETIHLPIRISVGSEYLDKVSNKITFKIQTVDASSYVVQTESRFLGPSTRKQQREY